MANFAIVGATGLVGTKMIERLSESKLEVDKIYLMASARSAGKVLQFRGQDVIVEELKEDSFDKEIDYAIFSAGGDTSRRFAPIAESKGIIVIDNSSAWRMEEDIDLIVPECNEPLLKRKIIANPNCSTIQSVVPLKPLADAFGLDRVAYTTYQAVSGSGKGGIDDLLNGQDGKEPKKYPHPIYNNVLPHIDVFLDNGYTKEEMKMINETHKILGDDSIGVTATTVRVPVLDSHSESINIEFKREFELNEVYDALSNAKGITVLDDPENEVYPLALDAAGTDDVYVGRIRRDFSTENAINIWVVSDNIRKGAATNTVQIAELLLN